MRRDLDKMADREHDLVVVGGGITGACIARDAALRGLSVALIEKGDFCQATSAASSKLIHGGLRYLRTYEFGLVRESLRERRIWEVIAPHMVHPLATMMPTYSRRGSPPKLLIRVGLTLYDMLAFDRNRLEDEDKKLPAHVALSREAALEAEPGLPTEGLTGAVVYYDCQMHSPERLCLEHLIDASKHGATVANYAEASGFLMDGNRVLGVEVRDTLTGDSFSVRGRLTVNASGPWADRLLNRLPGESPAKITRSQGIHVVTRELTRSHAVIMEHQGAHFFLLPWRGRTLIGTTDTVYKGDPDHFAVTEDDITDFLALINAGYPTAALTRDDVLYFYGGLRPLVETPEADGDTYSASRRAEVCDHGEADGFHNLLSALGGKWTTSRHLAEQVLDLAEKKLDRNLPRCRTDEEPLPGGRMERLASFRDRMRSERDDIPSRVVDHLVMNYGSMMDDVLGLGAHDASLLEPLGPGVDTIGAQVLHAVRNEMALSLEDFVVRRTGLGTLGPPTDELLEAAATLMGRELGWDADERAEQIDRVRKHYVAGEARAR